MNQMNSMGMHPGTKIKWLRLKRIAQDMSGRKVEISGSTSLRSEIKAAVQYDDKNVDIAINLGCIKSIKDVIAAISHELAHVILGVDTDDQSHQKEWVRLEEEITRLYHKGGVSQNAERDDQG